MLSYNFVQRSVDSTDPSVSATYLLSSPQLVTNIYTNSLPFGITYIAAIVEDDTYVLCLLLCDS